MKEARLIKNNTYLLFAVVPLSIVGYLFAVYEESLFFLYEWFLTLLLAGSVILSIVSIIKIKSALKWISISFLAFLIQFSTLSLFLGPFTFRALFPLFYVVALLSILIFVITHKKVDKFKSLPIIFIFLSIIFLFYMVTLNSLWGANLSLGLIFLIE
ncbi:hypothetical protein [Aneurinibacillus tyrosinisolvens]|uniref:hypothetical protein n=1 Tax=Aneurinibacillus tyrosinisolvens TaxID=1443435 RepID=UPI00063EDC8F|nr:hypothetical protein [Aneurinibacillus tyrosinisolvens]